MSTNTLADYCWDGRGYRQRDVSVTEKLGDEYARYYMSIDEQVKALAARRAKVLDTMLPERFTVNGRGRLLDFGCGTGRFVQAAGRLGWDAVGTDRKPCGKGFPFVLVAPGNGYFDVVTFFDSLEHLAEPDQLILKLSPKAIMASVPECHLPASDWFLSWKHRKPGEHMWHWNRGSLRQLMQGLGYREWMVSNFEDEFREPYDPGLPNILSGIYLRA